MTKLDGSPLSYMPNTATAVRRFRFPRQPTNADYKNFRLGDEWLDEASADWWKMTEKTATAGLWVRIGGTTGDIASLTGDSGGLVGPDGAHNIDIFGNPDIDMVGTPGTNSFQMTNLTKLSPYIVDSTGGAPYVTIQSAMDAANVAGGGIVFVRPGFYVENLVFYDAVHVVGTVRVNSDPNITIVGQDHAPPATGTMSIEKLFFFVPGVGDAISSNAAGTAAIRLTGCQFALTNGYELFVPNWTGTINMLDITGIGVLANEDGVFFNTAGATVFFRECFCGDGTVNPLTISGSNSFINRSSIQCPITVQGAAAAVVFQNLSCNNTITLAGTADLVAMDCIMAPFFFGYVVSSFVQSSANLLAILQTNIVTTAGNAIGGVGAGGVFLNQVAFESSEGINPALAISTGTAFYSGELRAPNISFDDGATNLAADGEIIIGDGTPGAVPKITTLSSDDGSVIITNGPGTIDLATSATGAPGFRNLGIAYNGGTGVFTVQGESGAALSAANPGYTTLQSKTNPGQLLRYTTIANQTFIDDVGASDIIGNLFGYVTGVAITNDVPFYLYAVSNDAETAVSLMTSRIPHATISPVAAKIGKTGSAIASTQGSFFALGNPTVADYDQNPCLLIGSFRMQMSAADDWTVQAITTADGIGQFQEGTIFDMNAGQLGAAAGKYFTDNGGTAPAGPGGGNYVIKKDGLCDYGFSLAGITTAGVGAVTLVFVLPVTDSMGGITAFGYHVSGVTSMLNGSSLGDVSVTQNIYYTNQNASGVLTNAGIILGDIISFNGNIQLSII